MFFIKKFPIPRWEAIPDPWASSRACIRCTMAALTDPGGEDVVIHRERVQGVVCKVTMTSRVTYAGCGRSLRRRGVILGSSFKPLRRFL